MNLSVLRAVPLLGSIAALCAPALAADFIKLQNTSALNTSGAWQNAAVPSALDWLVWDSTFTTPGTIASLSQMGGDLSVFGIRVTNVGGTQNLTTLTVGFQNASSANTLTLGAGGIDMSTATQIFAMQSRLAIAADQTWNVAAVNSQNSPTTGLGMNEDLAILATAANTPIDLGGHTVTKTGAGTAAFSSGHSISNGTFAVNGGTLHFQSGGSRVLNLNNTLNLQANNGGTVSIAVQSAAVNVNAPITLNTGGILALVPAQANALTIGSNINVAGNGMISIRAQANGNQVVGSTVRLNGSLVGSGNLDYNSTITVATGLRLNGDNSGYSGTFTMSSGTGTRLLILENANAGSAAATWNLTTGNTIQLNGVSVSLGTLNGAGAVNMLTGVGAISVGAGNFSGVLSNGVGTLGLTKVGSGTLTLTGANTYTGDTTVNAGTLIVTPAQIGAGAVTVQGGATFGVRITSPGTVFNASTVLTTAGSALSFDIGALGNPTTTPLFVSNFIPQGTTALKIVGPSLTTGNFPLIGYTGAIGGGGIGSLSLVLPFRVGGSLVDNPGVSVNVNITGVSKLTWSGSANGNWDVDTVGNGTLGTANWSATTGPNTYVEAAVGIDSAIFNDSAATANVNLTTNLSPNGIELTNSVLNYVFGGTGRLSGATGLTKNGSATLTIANLGNNDFSGGVTINAGRIKLGDGTTNNAGTLGLGAVTIAAPGTLELDRPDSFTLGVAIAGAGSLVKSRPGTATLSQATTLGGQMILNGGTLVLGAGGNISGGISGSGALTLSGGTLQLSGAQPNTNTGLVTVNNGTLQLNKAGVNAIAGDLLLTGTGLLSLLAGNQIADTSTITYDKATNGGNVILTETVGAINMLNGADAGGQVQAQNGFSVNGLLTAQNTSVFAVASNHSGSVGGLNVNGNSVIRIAANSNPSTLNVGALGITASGGTIQVGQGTGAFDAVLNLNGNVTTTGNFAFTDGAFVGTQLRQIQLGSVDRTFDIGANTTTTVAPEISGTGGIVKVGAGTLQLTAASASNYTGTTTVNAGRFLTTPAQIPGPVVVGGAGTFGVGLSVAGTTFTVPGITTSTGATLLLDTAGTGNPAVPVITVGALTVGSGTKINLTGSALAAATGIPLISYTGAIGGAGFPGLSVVLPARVAGTLVDNVAASRVDVDLTVEKIKWKGNVNTDWDIDPDGTGATGTVNWVTTVLGTPVRYFQGPVGVDSVNFDDSATGTGVVKLTTALTPVAVVVDNNAKTYTFQGSGRLTGATSLTKNGPGKLIVATTGPFDYTGGTTINAGTLEVGDGVTVGAGTLPAGVITNNGTLSINRPDDVAVAQAITGSGNVLKRNTNVLTIPAAVTNLLTNFTIEAGTLRFSGGGSISGIYSGPGTLESSAGTLVISGAAANTQAKTVVSGGTLQLNMLVGAGAAVGNDVQITGTGVLAILGTEQIPDTATITFTGTSGDCIAGSTLVETVGNVVCSPSVATAQFLMHTGFAIAGTGSVSSGILGIRSNATVSMNALNISGGLLRIAGNGGPSILNVGAGGITASGGEIQVKFNTNDQDATLNLSGDYMGRGNVVFFPAHWDPKLRIPRGQVVAAASIVSPKY